jgi:hypothetical protein
VLTSHLTQLKSRDRTTLEIGADPGQGPEMLEAGLKRIDRLFTRLGFERVVQVGPSNETGRGRPSQVRLSFPEQQYRNVYLLSDGGGDGSEPDRREITVQSESGPGGARYIDLLFQDERYDQVRIIPWESPGAETLELRVFPSDPGKRKNRSGPPAFLLYPVNILYSNLRSGSMEIPAGLKNLKITFDRDMYLAMEWDIQTSSGSLDVDQETGFWHDWRTCVLPLDLNRAEFYSVRINPGDKTGFRDIRDQPALTEEIRFTTEGAGDDLVNRIRKPGIIKMVPSNGQADVDPELTELRITFDLPMSPDHAWIGSREQFPNLPENMDAWWTEDQKTCVLPVGLEPGKKYFLGLNSRDNPCFRSQWDMVLDPLT